MNTGFGFIGSTVLGLGVLVGSTGLARAQVWSPIAGDGGTVTAVVTTGAVTHVEYTWYLGGCQRVSSLGPLVRAANHFSYDFSLESESGVPCPAYVILEKANVVLGTLAPGSYTLTTTSWNVPISQKSFTICPSLQSLERDTNGCFQIQLSCGITNVSYILQCSSNLVDWISLSTNYFATNSVGVRLTDNSDLSAGWLYYRVKCP
jgi:hypothetical protein